MNLTAKTLVVASLVAATWWIGSPARADFFESFEGGVSTDWVGINYGASAATAVATDELGAAASDGTYALKITSSDNGYDQVVKRESLLSQLQLYDTVDLDIYVPAITGPEGTYAQAALSIISDSGGYSAMTPNYDLVQGMNHLTWNYGDDGVAPGGTWAIFDLVTNTSALGPNPISPFYIDSFRLSDSTPPPPFKMSFENTFDGWYVYDGPGISSVDASGGAPAGAITDGDYAMKVEVGPLADTTLLARVDASTEMLQAMKDNDTIEMDFFVETGEIFPTEYAVLGLVLNHQAGLSGVGYLDQYQTFTTEEAGTVLHYTYNYGSDPDYNPDTTWVQFGLLGNANNGAGASEISEFFVDNIYFSTASTGTPGDFDEDGDVDGNDFLVWQRDTSVGSLAVWETHFGGTGDALGAASAVPEPTAAVLCLVGCMLVVMQRKV